MYFEFVLVEALGYRTRGELLRVMSGREFAYWQQFYRLRGDIQAMQSQHPKWSGAEILDWIAERDAIAKEVE